MSSVAYDEIRREIVEYGNVLLAQGLTNGTSGNVSRRTTDGGIAISPSGIPYDEIEPSDVPIIDRDGNRVEGTKRPSVESPMHTAVYRERDDVGGIVHSHSPFATTFATLGKPIPPTHYLIATIGDRIPVAEYETFGTDDLGDTVVETLGTEYQACLLESHGVLAVGDTLETALDTALTVETCARIHYQASLLGDPDPLDPAELERLETKFEGYGV